MTSHIFCFVQGTKNSNNEEVMAKLGQKQGHYSVLWWFLGRGLRTQLMCLEAFSGSLMSCNGWAKKSYRLKLWRRAGTTKEETREWVEHGRSRVKQGHIIGLKYSTQDSGWTQDSTMMLSLTLQCTLVSSSQEQKSSQSWVQICPIQLGRLVAHKFCHNTVNNEPSAESRCWLVWLEVEFMH